MTVQGLLLINMMHFLPSFAFDFYGELWEGIPFHATPFTGAVKLFFYLV